MGRVVRFAGVLTSGDMLRALEELEGYHVALRTLNQWVHDGPLNASIRGPRGRRRDHWFSRDDLIRARLIARLRREGLPLQRVRIALAALGDELTQAVETGRGRIVVNRERGTARLIKSGRAVEALTGQYVLPLRELLNGLDATAERMQEMG